jgi:hypothetical protein
MAILNIIRNHGDDLYDMRCFLPEAVAASSSDLSSEIVELEENTRIAPADDLGGALEFNQKALQRYILHCGQQVEGGGLRGKVSESNLRLL